MILFSSLRSGLILGCLTLPLLSSAQNLPDEYFISDDGLRLVAGGREIGGLYSEDEIKVIRLTFAQANYWTLLENSEQTGVHIMATLEYNGNVWDSVGVKLKGQTSYDQLPNGSQKFSFDINMDAFVDGQDIAGFESFNLHNGFQDNSVMRDVLYKHLIRPHVPAAKACFAQLYINGANWGHYNMVEDLDSEFIRAWWWSNNGARWRADSPAGTGGGGGPQWGDGTAALNYLDDDTSSYQTYYTLGRSEIANPWDKLVLTCKKLETTAIGQLADTLDKCMDIDRCLWHLAAENAFADDDSYIYKGKMDYSLYWDPETERMTTQEIDGNSILGNMALSWSPFYHADNANYPMLNRVLQVPELRQRYLAHLRHIMATSMQQADVAALIAQYRALIDTVVQNDPIKLMTYAQFNTACTTLGNACNTRRNNLQGNAEVAQVPPVIEAVEHESPAGIGQEPYGNEVVHVRASASHANGLARVRLYWSNLLPGRFQHVDMVDDGAHDDGASGDGIYGAEIPGQAAGRWIRYYIEAQANTAALTVAYSPAGAEHDVYLYQVITNTSPSAGVVINELMASNGSTVMDNNDQYEDWIELYNGTGNAVDLEGWYLTDTPFEPTKWEIPGGTLMAPDSYLIVWADEDQSQGAMHANFKLSATGESVLLYDTDTLLVDQVDFDAQETDMGYARVPNGTGPFVIQAPTFGANNNALGMATANNTNIRMYPNPAGSQVVLVWSGMEARPIEIIDGMQRTVWSGTVRSGSSIDVADFAAGTYVVRTPMSNTKLVVLH